MTVPGFLAETTSPVSLAARNSMPVATSGASGLTSGTACLCMLEPISARLASSCSRNGMSAVATLTVWRGETSMYSTSLASTMETSSPSFGARQSTRSFLNRPDLVSGALAWAMMYWSSSSAVRYLILSVTTPFLTSRYGAQQEPELVDAGVGGEVADEADVRAFGRLDGAHAAVVRRVDVAHLEPGALAGEAARPQRGKPALVGEPGQRVGLVHELGQLARPEELLDGRHHRPDVDEGLRGDGVDVLGGHALPDHPLHAGEADAYLVLDELADGADPAVAEVVDVVDLARRLPSWRFTM